MAWSKNHSKWSRILPVHRTTSNQFAGQTGHFGENLNEDEFFGSEFNRNYFFHLGFTNADTNFSKTNGCIDRMQSAPSIGRIGRFLATDRQRSKISPKSSNKRLNHNSAQIYSVFVHPNPIGRISIWKKRTKKLWAKIWSRDRAQHDGVNTITNEWVLVGYSHEFEFFNFFLFAISDCISAVKLSANGRRRR